MKKIGNRPITEADTDFSKISTKSEQNFDEFWSFMSAPFGTVTQCSVEPTVPKGALRKFQNSSKFCSNYKVLWISLYLIEKNNPI